MSQIKIGKWIVVPEKSVIKDGNKDISIKPLSMKILCCLIESNGDIVSKDDLVDKCWKGKFVSDDAIRQAIKDLRDYIGCSGYESNYIETVRGQGYKLICNIEDYSDCEVKSDTKTPNNKVLLIATWLMVVTVISFLSVFYITKNNSYKLSKDSVILTYGEAREVDYSETKQGWSAYSVLKDGGSFGEKIEIRNPNKEIVNTIYPTNKKGHVTSPAFNTKGDKLAYIDYHPKSCFIKIINPIKNYEIESVSCSKSDYLVALDWYSENELYYSTSANESSPLSMHYYNLENKEHHKLTSPNIGGRGDYFTRICNNSMLILRNEDYITVDVILYDIENKKERIITKIDEPLLTIDWLENCNDAVFYLRGKGLYQLSINNGKINPIDENIRNVKELSVHKDYLYASIGNYFNIEVVYLDSNLNVKEKPIVSSNGNNISVVTNQHNNNFIFVSSRTGKNQLWISQDNKERQLTKFDELVDINSITWSVDDKDIVYFSEDNNIWSLNLSTAETKILHVANGSIKSIAYFDDKNIVYSSHTNGLWQGFLLNILSKKSKPLNNLSIKEFKRNLNNELYFRLQSDDIYLYDFNAKKSTLITEIPTNSLDWMINKNVLNYIVSGKLLEKNIDDNTTRTLLENNNLGIQFYQDSLNGFYLEKHKSGLIDVKKYKLISS